MKKRTPLPPAQPRIHFKKQKNKPNLAVPILIAYPLYSIILGGIFLFGETGKFLKTKPKIMQLDKRQEDRPILGGFAFPTLPQVIVYQSLGSAFRSYVAQNPERFCEANYQQATTMLCRVLFPSTKSGGM
ncbi:MAG: hypothetical protein NT002_05730 [candidate division Zixibacteria bacterium]|nr:hypothetical protein [candidate division Zixibacteria bacterium]